MPPSPLPRLLLPARLLADLLSQALAESPLECCGLLAGPPAAAGAEAARVTARYPLPNAAASPREYQGDARATRAAFEEIDARGLALHAVYHSHPAARAVPSRTDLERNAFGADVVHLIVSLLTEPPTVRGWRLGENDYHEADWQTE
jgi:proteasome lid subunit RPN8/RPN11